LHPDLAGQAQAQGPDGVVDDVGAHVAEGPGAVVEESPPLEGDDLGTVGFVGGGPEPEGPVEALRGGFGGGTDEVLGPDRPVGAAMDLGDLPDGPGANVFVGEAGALGGVSGVAHLGADPRL